MSEVAFPAGLIAAVAGRYELRRELGRGGMAAVYLAIMFLLRGYPDAAHALHVLS